MPPPTSSSTPTRFASSSRRGTRRHPRRCPLRSRQRPTPSAAAPAAPHAVRRGAACHSVAPPRGPSHHATTALPQPTTRHHLSRLLQVGVATSVVATAGIKSNGKRLKPQGSSSFSKIRSRPHHLDYGTVFFSDV